MDKKSFSVAAARVALLMVCLGSFLGGCSAPEPSQDPEKVVYLGVDQLQELMDAGSLTSEELVAFHLGRIAALDDAGPDLSSILEINPDASRIAASLDEERAESGARGPLHGIPVVLKGNIDTGDRMTTTAGSLALEGHRAASDAFHVRGLREAGAVILGKANLSEWANFRSTRSSSGWSGLGGQVRNPHVLDRSPCGSSSGSAVAVAAGLAVLALGTETDGSIVCPAGVNGVVGIKPTVGLVSRDGIIPIAHSQDTAGPMARSVRDASLLLGAISAPDPEDPAASGHPGQHDYTAALRDDALRGARIGVWRGYPGAERSPRVADILERTLSLIEGAGAVLVDPLDLPVPEGAGDGEWEVLQYEFKAGLNEYLDSAGVDSDRDTLAELIVFNREHRETSMPWFGQEIFESAVEKGPLTEPAYLEALEKSRVAMARAIDHALDAGGVDAIIAPTNGPAWPIDWVAGDRFTVGSSTPAAVSGYPSVTLPMGEIHGLPIGVTLVGRPYSEANLIGLAHALESLLPPRSVPGFRPTLEAN